MKKKKIIIISIIVFVSLVMVALIAVTIWALTKKDHHAHSYSGWMYRDALTHERSCKCGVVQTNSHTWNKGVVTITPTIDDDGEITYTCSDCGGTKKETVPANTTFTVQFCDYDGTVLLEQTVWPGADADPPTDPYREGYRFDKWDNDYSGVVSDLKITAVYVKVYEVTFIDYDNSIIDTQLVDLNGSAIPPEDPVRSNYRFVGWDREFADVVSDMTVKAEYIRQYKVRFLDYDGSLLKEVWVDTGTSADPPIDPTLDGYDFIGWDTEYSNILSDLSVKALYQLKTYTVRFVLPDGTLIENPQMVEHGFDAIAPQPPEVFLSGSGGATKAYGFTRWNKEFNAITEDTVIEAVYESPYTEMLIIIEFGSEQNQSVNLYILNASLATLNAIEFTISFSTSSGNISIDAATVNRASPLWVGDSYGNNANQYVINNNEKQFTFAWSDATGKQFDWCSNVITFSFSTDGAVVDNGTFVVENCSAVISDSNGENIEKVTPKVIYR